MPGSKQLENPMMVLRDLLKRVGKLERVQRLPSLMGIQLVLSADQTFASSLAVSQVLFDATLINTDGLFDAANNKILIPNDLNGYYYIYAQSAWLSNASGIRRVRIRKNGSAITDGTITAVSGSTTVHHTQVLTYLNEGDNVDLAVFQNSGGNLVLNSGLGTDVTHLTARFVGM